MFLAFLFLLILIFAVVIGIAVAWLVSRELARSKSGKTYPRCGRGYYDAGGQR